MTPKEYSSIINAIMGVMSELHYKQWLTNRAFIVLGILIGLLLILGIVIVVNQIRIRKQLRRIQEQLEQKEDKDVS